MSAYSSSFHITFDAPDDVPASLEPSISSATGSAHGAAHDPRLRASDLGKLARRAQRRIVQAARAEDRLTFARLIPAHLGIDSASVDVVEEVWPTYEHVNVQVGLDSWLSSGSRSHTLVGVTNFRHRHFDLSELMRASVDSFHGGLAPGNVARRNLPVGPAGEVRACVVCAIYLVSEGDHRAALLVRMGDSDMGDPISRLEIAADSAAYADRIAAEVRAAALEHNVYRGQVVSFGHDTFGERQALLSFHQRPVMTADELILPDTTVDAITRQVVGVARHRELLIGARQHLKRGVLLHGPPGVGKTHTVRYLLSQLTGTTIVQLAGDTLRLIGAACSVARSLQPAMIVIEDVDLIAEDRGDHPGRHPLLFELLNEMDGLDEDVDVVFLLTTNRADVLEPALAQRPGRVDQAVAVDLPDLEGRRRLFALYRGSLEVDQTRLDSVLARTDGVTASFLKELLRRAAVLAAEAATAPVDGSVTEPVTGDHDPAGTLTVSADQLDAALDELLDTRNAMTRVLLGGQRG